MTELSRNRSRRFSKAQTDLRLLRSLGVADPQRVGALLSRCLSHPGLRIENEEWVIDLLLSARPRFGAEALLALADHSVRAGEQPLDLKSTPSLPMILGSSNFLARLLQYAPGWVAELQGKPPPAPENTTITADWASIREAKYRGLLRIAARDLVGRSFCKSLTELTDLADRCLTAGLLCASEETGVDPPSVLAVGKLGGRELNFSSDVDLLFIYDAPSGSRDLKRNHEITRLIRRLKFGLEERSNEGFGYRVDLDLRPEGPSGVLANSVSAALHYYESFGADWERQALLRIRHVAGPKQTSKSLIRGLKPFVYRRAIDTSALHAVRAMKRRIENERQAAGRKLDRDLKEGPGGIRDVEFLVQALQLFHGGQDPAVRSGNTLKGLEALAKRGYLPDLAASTLQESYLWLRRAEHSLQLEEERQVHNVPTPVIREQQLARRMGYRDETIQEAHTAFLTDWRKARTEVRGHFEALLPEDVREQP